MNANGDYTGTFLQLLNPYSLLVARDRPVPHRHSRRGLGRAQVGGRAARARACSYRQHHLLGVRGAGGGDVRRRRSPRSRARRTTCFGRPLGWFFLVVLALSLLYTILQMMKEGGELRSFLGSAVTIVALAGIAAVGNYPEIVPARGTPPDTSLTVTNAASGHLTLAGDARSSPSSASPWCCCTRPTSTGRSGARRRRPTRSTDAAAPSSTHRPRRAAGLRPAALLVLGSRRHRSPTQKHTRTAQNT